MAGVPVVESVAVADDLVGSTPPVLALALVVVVEEGAVVDDAPVVGKLGSGLDESKEDARDVPPVTVPLSSSSNSSSPSSSSRPVPLDGSDGSMDESFDRDVV